jgi:ribosome maturation factor RimP
VTIDDCEALSRAVDGPLDEADPIEQQYYLEVSSPGIERRLRQSWHFKEELGKKVKVRLIRPDESGGREFEGELTGFDEPDGTIRVAAPDGERSVKLSQTAFVRLSDTEDYFKE